MVKSEIHDRHCKTYRFVFELRFSIGNGKHYIVSAWFAIIVGYCCKTRYSYPILDLLDDRI